MTSNIILQRKKINKIKIYKTISIDVKHHFQRKKTDFCSFGLFLQYLQSDLPYIAL